MSESQHHYRADQDEYVEFVRAGERAVGEFECVGCNFRTVVHGDLLPCGTCGGDLWERTSWSPFGSVLGPLRSRIQ
jgi:hypothetical protein